MDVVQRARRERLARPTVAAAVDIAVLVSFDFMLAAAVAEAEEKEDLIEIAAADPDMLPAFLAKLKCVGCGCTQERACPGGCSWLSFDPPLCSSCA